MALQASVSIEHLPFPSTSYHSPWLIQRQQGNGIQQLRLKIQKTTSEVMQTATSKVRQMSSISQFCVTSQNNAAMAMVEGRLGSQGPGLMEKPGLDQADTAGGVKTEEGGEMGKLRARIRRRGGSRYRVLLLDHERHIESYVITVLPKVVPMVTEEQARQAFHDSRELGAGLVIVAVREHAEYYAQMMVRKGLRSTIEPEGIPS